MYPILYGLLRSVVFNVEGTTQTPTSWEVGPPGRLASIIALAKTKPANCRLRLKILSQKEVPYRIRSCFMRGLLETCLPPLLKTESSSGTERIFAYFPKNIFYYRGIVGGDKCFQTLLIFVPL